jgi:N-acetylneuraminic acid mutarotase
VIRTTRQALPSSSSTAAAVIVPPFEALEARTLFCSEHYYAGLQNDPADFGAGPMPTAPVAAELQPGAGESQTFTLLQVMAFPMPMLTYAALAAPSAPSSFSATKFSSSGIALAWKDNSTIESGFKIERKLGSSGSWSQIATVGAGVTSYNDTGLAANTYYVYRVRAYNSAGNSSYSNEDGSTTLAGSTPSAIGTLKWSSVASSSAARSEGQSAVVGGKLYVFGGVNTSGPFARSDVYDPSSNSWKRIADLPKKLTHAGTAVVDRNVYFAGGYIGTSSSGWAQDFATRDVWRYNVDSNSYSSMAQLPSARGGGVLVAVGRKLHFISGADSSRADRTEHWVLDLDNTGAGWKTLASIPSGKSHLGGVALNGKIYVVAGQKKYDDNAICQSDVHVYNPATNAWTKLANMPRALSHHGASTFVYNGRIIVAGGETAPHSPTSKVSAYDPSTNKWTDLTSLPSSRTSGAAGAINGALYFATGSVKTNTWKGIFS